MSSTSLCPGIIQLSIFFSLLTVCIPVCDVHRNVGPFPIQWWEYICSSLHVCCPFQKTTDISYINWWEIIWQPLCNADVSGWDVFCMLMNKQVYWEVSYSALPGHSTLARLIVSLKKHVRFKMNFTSKEIWSCNTVLSQKIYCSLPKVVSVPYSQYNWSYG